MKHNELRTDQKLTSSRNEWPILFRCAAKIGVHEHMAVVVPVRQIVDNKHSTANRIEFSLPISVDPVMIYNQPFRLVLSDYFARVMGIDTQVKSGAYLVFFLRDVPQAGL